LLLGFLHPDNGGIFINHMQVDERMRQAYWPSISYIKQDTFLLHGTILHNITLEDDHDQKRLHTAIDASGLREFLDADPQGLHKIIKENGKNISGGQRQRIAIARALYKNADLIILDEPFNELDEAAETGLLEYFQQQAKKGKLIILITHNKQSLAFCNKIITVDERTTADAYYPDPGISKK